jgi:riboflavin kinase
MTNGIRTHEGGSRSGNDIGYRGLEMLKHLAVDGARDGYVEATATELASKYDRDVSSQTISRRLRALEDGEYISRGHAGNGQTIHVTDRGCRLLEREYRDYQYIFECENGIEIRGVVTSGMGEGAHYISRSGYVEQFVARLGYEPHPGTLNVRLSDDSIVQRAGLAGTSGIQIDSWEGAERTYGAAVCYPVDLRAGGDCYRKAHVIVPDRTHHGEKRLEVIAPDRLRDVLSLEDGDQIRVTVEDSTR